MGDERPVLTCSCAELFFMAGLLGANRLLGVDDPFMGWLAGEIEEAWLQARQALESRSVLAASPDGGLIMDTGAAAIVGTCAFPNASLVVTCTEAGGQPLTRYFHLTQSLAVEQALANGECQLAPMEGSQAVYRQITDLLGLREQRAPVGAGAVLIPEKALTEARAAAAETGAPAAGQVLLRAGLAGNTAEALAVALSAPVSNGALLGLALRGIAWETAGLGLLEGQHGLWHLRAIRRSAEDWVEITPCSAGQAREYIRRLMNRFAPEPVFAE